LINGTVIAAKIVGVIMLTNKRIILSCIIIMVLFLIPATSFSDVTFTTLEPITSGLRFPEDVAVSSDGSVYVVDGSKGKVLIYDKKGLPEGSISVASPTSVAVNNGNIYIGSNKDLSVKIYNSSHNIIGLLGSGAGEFKLPRNIAIDGATGNVYVVDELDYSIKVYTSSGVFISKINDYPDQPQDVTIMNNEIYVIDHPLITLSVNGQAGTIRGAEVSVFDIAGNHIRDFGTYGSEEGQFIRPAGITSDADGILYITDSFHGVVMCFDTTQNDSYLGAIHNPSKPMGTPMGIALGGDRRLFVASLFTASVYVFGLEGYTGGIDVSPSVLSFTAQEGQANPSNQTLTISNSGADTQSYSATRTQSWIILGAPPVAVSPGSPGVISVGINISGLSSGTYYGEITITAGSGASEDIPVTLEVTAPPAPPVLSVTPQTLDYTYRIGDPAPSSKAVTIELSNVSSTTTWTATPDSAWISIDPSTMLANNDLLTVANVEVNPSNLEAGTHTGNITINAPGAYGSPATVEVILTIKNGGTIEVNCNIEDASFTIESPVTYEGSGQSWTATEVPDGTHTITYNPVIGYKTPPSETQTISGGGTVTFEGNYISLAMSANIVVSKNIENKKTTLTIGIFDSNGTMQFSFIPFSESDFDKYSFKPTSKTFLYVVNTAAGDIDGDGKADIVVAPGSSLNTNPALVAAYTAEGTLIPGSDFIALSTMYGANIAAADFDGDGKAEIVVGAGANSNNPAQVRIFTYNSDSETIEDTGIDFNAFTVKGGVNIATGDVDGDGIPELITAAGARKNNSPEVKVWEVETSAATWSINNTVSFIAFSGKYGANVTTGDLNGDGTSEIIVGSGPDPKGDSNIIKVFSGNGTEFDLMITDSSKGYGLNVASADLDNDGVAEIVAGLGPSSKNPSTVKIYKVNGTVHTFTAFDGTRYGAVVSVGDLGY
jgi:hypothetical protein